MIDDAACALLMAIPGGRDFLQRLDDRKEMGDSEIVSLELSRANASQLVIDVLCAKPPFRALLRLGGWVDVDLRGWSAQNVIADMHIRLAPPRRMEPWERGVDCDPGEIALELTPCLGAYGHIRAHIQSIICLPLPE